jgi:Protein of unknown function (DUF2917)
MKSSLITTTLPGITTALPLVHKATMRIEDPAGLEITCMSGSLWLTLDNDPRDVILTAGTADASFSTDKHSVAVLYALEDSQVAVAAVCTQVAYAQCAPVHARREGSGSALLPLVPA